MQADRLESQMRVQLEIQEGIDLRLEQRGEELRQLRSQSQANGAQLAALSLQLQELISSVESRAEVVEKDLEEINGRFDCHRGEINCLKIREKDAKEETKKLKGFIVGAGHEAQVFKNRLDRIEEKVCRCGRTPSEVGEEFVSSEDEGRTELSYASVREEEYVPPPVENSVPLPIPAPAPCCQGNHNTTLLALEEITEEPSFICEDLDGLLREADEERARELGEGSSNSVVHSPPQVGSQQWRRLNGIHHMHPGPGRRDQRETRSHPYLKRDTSRRPRELWGPGGSGESRGSKPCSSLGTIDTSLLRGDEGFPSSSSGRLGLVLQGEELVRPPGAELGLWIAIHLRIGLSEVEGDAFLGALGVDRMEDAPVVEMEGNMEVVDAEFECRDGYRSTSGSTSQFGNLEGFLSRKITFRLLPVSVESKSCFSFVLSVSGDQQIRKRMIENKLVRET